MIIQFIVSLFATLSFAELFGAPKKELFFCGLTLVPIGWVVYVIGLNSNMGTVLAESDRHLRTHRIFAYSVRDPQKSGNRLPHRRYFSAGSRSRYLLYVLLFHHERYDAILQLWHGNHQWWQVPSCWELSLASVCRRAGLTHCSE